MPLRRLAKEVNEKEFKMSVQNNLELDQENIAAWNAHDVDRLLAILSDEVVWRDVGNPQPLRGKEGARQFAQGWFSAFPDIKLTVTNRVITEDQVATEVEFTGTNSGPLVLAPGVPPIPATNKMVNAKGTYFLRIKNSKAVEVRTYPDAAGLMMQLGLIPMPDA
jgi:steroid delta-isomerase-like uncharacterized protein